MQARGLLIGAALGVFFTPQAIAADLLLTDVAIPSVYELEARVEPVNSGTISAQTSGVIRAVHGDVNDRVNQGDLLIEIDDTQARAEVAQADAALAQARALNDDAQALLKRNTRLQKQGTLSEGEYDRSVAQAGSTAASVAAARAALTQAQAQLSYTRVTAPYAGIITARHVEVGELINPGQPLMSGYSPTKLRVVTDLPQRLASQFNDVSQLSISGPSDIAPESATLFPYADPQQHSVRLRATIPADASDQLMPGQWLKLTFRTGERQGVAIPESALLTRGEMTAVYVHDQGKYSLRQVRAGKRFQQDGASYIEILAGLRSGETISDDALMTLQDIAAAGE